MLLITVNVNALSNRNLQAYNLITFFVFIKAQRKLYGRGTAGSKLHK